MSKIDAFNVILERLRPLLDEEAIAAFAELHRRPGIPPEAIGAAAGRLRELASQIPKTGPVLQGGLPFDHELPLRYTALLSAVVEKTFYLLALNYNPPGPAPVDDQHIAWEPAGDASAAAIHMADGRDIELGPVTVDVGGIPTDDDALETYTSALRCEYCGGRLERSQGLEEYICPTCQCELCGEWLEGMEGECLNPLCERHEIVSNFCPHCGRHVPFDPPFSCGDEVVE